LDMRRAGHDVYALMRNKEKDGFLRRNEINVVIADLLKPDTYFKIAQECQILIHCASDGSIFEKLDVTTTNTLLQAAASTGKKSKMLIYTSGILVYPDNPNGLSDETTPTNAKGVFTSRPQTEQKVINSPDVVGVVIRPAFVFGKKSTHFYEYFRYAEGGRVVISGRPEVGYSEVHIDDLVEGYRKVVESPYSTVDGQIFTFADDSRNTKMMVATAFARATGFGGPIEFDLTKIYEQSNKIVFVDYRKATRLLGWSPRHRPMLDEVHLYYRHWKAMQGRY